MTFRSILSTVALAGALAGTAYAHGVSPGVTASGDARSTPYGDALIQTETSPDDSSMSRGAFDWVASTGETTVRGVVEGQVAAVEHGSGRFVLDTDDGLIGFVTSPDELEGVEVGDVVRVSFLTDESD